jgi:hypothetical protein
MFTLVTLLFGFGLLFVSSRYFLIALANMVRSAIQTNSIRPIGFTVLASCFCLMVVALCIIATVF